MYDVGAKCVVVMVTGTFELRILKRCDTHEDAQAFAREFALARDRWEMYPMRDIAILELAGVWGYEEDRVVGKGPPPLWEWLPGQPWPLEGVTCPTTST
jgi:hypothetical protein